MSGGSWLVIVVWGGPVLVGTLIFLWSELHSGQVDSFEKQRAEAARWMQQESKGLEHWWGPEVLTDLNPNPCPRLPYDVAVYIFMDMAQRGLLLPDIVGRDVDIDGQKVVIH